MNKNSSELGKFYLSLNGGYNYAFGTNNFVSYDDIDIPFNKSIFTPGFDGAYFFSKNYGIGLKYRFNKGKYKGESASEHSERTDDYYFNGIKENKISLKETSHFVCPSIYARWSLGESKWIFSANAGVGYFYNKLSDIFYWVNYYTLPTDQIVLYGLPDNKKMGASGLKGTSIGFSLSSGVHYRITPLIGIGIDANGFFASTKPRMEYINILTGEPCSTEVERKINQLGVSASIDFYF